MKEKSDIFSCFCKFKWMVEKQSGTRIKCLRLDGGGEYFSNEFSDFLCREGIRRQFTCRYTPQQNGVPERKNRTLADIPRAMMAEKHMLLYYWAEAVNTSNYILNRCITSAVHGITLEECFYGRKRSIEHLKVFGCLAYVHVPTELRSKLNPKSEKCILVGYSKEKKRAQMLQPIDKEDCSQL